MIDRPWILNAHFASHAPYSSQLNSKVSLTGPFMNMNLNISFIPAAAFPVNGFPRPFPSFAAFQR